MTELPEVAPGHWETPAGRDMAQSYTEKTRARLGYGDRSDFEIANDVFMLNTMDLGGAAVLTAGKERIRWLSTQLVLANAKLAAFNWVAGLYEGRGLTRDDIAAELADLRMIAGEVGKVYDHVTGGRVSKPTTLASVVISLADDRLTELVEEEIKDSGLARAAEDF